MNTFLKSTTTALLLMPFVTNATEITNTQITSTGVKIVIDLDSNLKTGEKVKIDYGKGLKAMSCKNISCSITFTATAALPKNETTLDYKIGIYKGNTLLDSTLKNGTVNFVISTPSSTGTLKGEIETFVSGDRTFSYTKVANDGSELPKTAKLGTDSKDWACTKDNNTGLIWEVKTNDGGLHDMNHFYTNYDQNYQKCDDNVYGGEGACNKFGLTGKFGDKANADVFVKAVNKQNLCGHKNWRLPTNQELQGLVYCSSGQYNNLTEEMGTICAGDRNSIQSPTINLTYFPNTQNSWYWSSSSYVDRIGYAWTILFQDSSNFSFGSGKDHANTVRLVSDDAQ